MKGTLAITGGTGFVGSTLVRLAAAAGWQVRALTRRPQPAQDHVEWIAGALDEADSLATLLEGADAVIHVAGVTNTPTREGFIAGNIDGTAAMIAAAQAAKVQRFIHVSSLSAREPTLSNYGWSKAEAEKRVLDSSLGWTIVRPPAIYGPGDKDHLDLFKAARCHVMPLPPAGSLSTIEVSDLAKCLLKLAETPATVGHVFEVDDGRAGGWTHADYARAIGSAIGKWVLPLPVPAIFIALGARFDRLLRGDKAKLTADRAAYFCHQDWVIDPRKRPPPALWEPRIETREGLAETGRAYRACGWL